MLDIIKPFLLIYEEQQTRLCQCLILLLVHAIMLHIGLTFGESATLAHQCKFSTLSIIKI